MLLVPLFCGLCKLCVCVVLVVVSGIYVCVLVLFACCVKWFLLVCCLFVWPNMVDLRFVCLCLFKSVLCISAYIFCYICGVVKCYTRAIYICLISTVVVVCGVS